MAELVHMLHHEEAGMTVDRSLEGAPGDVLSFEVFVTGRWRQVVHYPIMSCHVMSCPILSYHAISH